MIEKMITIDKFREKYPRFRMVEDADLTREIHKRYFPSMPFDQFAHQFAPSTFPERPPIFKQPSPGVITPPITGHPRIAGFLTEDTLGGHLMKQMPTIAGGTIGGIAGAAIPTVGEEAVTIGLGMKLLGQGVLGPFFAGVGGGIGEMYTMAAGDELKRTPESARRIGGAFLREAGTELVGNTITGALGRVLLRPFSKTIVEGADIADEALRRSGTRTARPARTIFGKAARGLERKIVRPFVSKERFARLYGAHLRASQASESFIDVVGAISEGSLFGGTRLRTFTSTTQRIATRNFQDKVTYQLQQNLIDRVGTRKAKTILRNLSTMDNADEIKAVVGSLYKIVDDEAGESLVGFGLLRERGISETERWQRIGTLKGKRRSMLKTAIGQADDGTFESAKDLRSHFLDLQRQFKGADDRINARIAGELAGEVDTAMAKAATDAGPNVEALWRTANDVYRGQFRMQWLTDLMTNTADVDGVVIGQSFLKKFNKIGERGLREMGWAADEITAIKTVGEVARFVGTKPAAGGGSMLIKLVQAGAIMEVGGAAMTVTGVATESKGLTTGGTMIMFGPAVMARILASPTGAKLFSQGLRMPMGTKAASNLGLRILREAQWYEAERLQKGFAPQINSIEFLEPQEETPPKFKAKALFGD